MLSEKAKGKQKALEPEETDAGPPPKSLVIRFTEGVPDLTVVIEQKDTIRDIKKNVRVPVQYRIS